jgi:hypothetical protein
LSPEGTECSLVPAENDVKDRGTRGVGGTGRVEVWGHGKIVKMLKELVIEFKMLGRVEEKKKKIETVDLMEELEIVMEKEVEVMEELKAMMEIISE